MRTVAGAVVLLLSVPSAAAFQLHPGTQAALRNGRAQAACLSVPRDSRSATSEPRRLLPLGTGLWRRDARQQARWGRRGRGTVFALGMTSSETETETAGASGAPAQACKEQGAFDTCVTNGETKEAVRLLRAYDDLAISNDQAWRMLDAIPLDVSEENETEQQILVSLTYASLRKRNILRGFGAVPVTPDALPLRTKEVDVTELEKAIALPMSALTPKGSSVPWTAIGLGFCGIEFALAQQLGYDPMRSVVPLTALAVVTDRALLSGAVFESVTRFLFPKYKQKVIQHEAGHFLLAYLLGCPIQGFFLSAWDASAAGIRGQAGTVFFDNDLSSQLKANKVTRTAIDRYTIVLMAGIAAEALTYEQAEGGASDESALVNFLVGLSPPWDQQRVFNQARWAVTQAVLLIKEHQSAYNKLVAAMAAGESLGACVQVIEDELAKEEVLPVTNRILQRQSETQSASSSTSGNLMPSQPSPALKELDAKIQAKRLELEAIQQKEAELQEQIRNLDSQPTPAAGSGGEGAGQGAGEAWDKAETQRFMDSLLKAQRARKTKEAVAKASAANADKNLDVLLEAATRERKLAEVDLKLKQKEMELQEIESKLKDSGKL